MREPVSVYQTGITVNRGNMLCLCCACKTKVVSVVLLVDGQKLVLEIYQGAF